MNVPTTPSQMCDECGKTVAKIWRVHHGHKYCSTCYSRVFKRRMCPKCGNYAKLPKNDPNAICQKCQVDKPCVRCGKTDYEVGKITSYGPVCSACASHFREAEACEDCGALSKRLTRVSRLGHHRRVCPRCARADHAVCVACRRYRLLEQAADGRMLCSACLEQGTVPCSSCNEPMPAGRGKQCEACYWRELLNKRLTINCAAFSVPAMAEHFIAFGEWLGSEVGHQKAAINLHRYLPFFLEIEKQWKAIPDFQVLLKYFGTLRLRRALLPMNWMQSASLVVPDTLAKQEDSEQRRIASTMEKVGQSTEERILLNNYYKELLEDLKAAQTTLRSVRLAITPAAALLIKGREMGQMPPDQRVLDSYLAQTPGQRAAVARFVRYLRERNGAEIHLPKANSKAKHNRRKKQEAELLLMMQEGVRNKEFRHKLIVAAVSYFHDVPKHKLSNLTNVSMVPSDDGVTVNVNEVDYWLPQKIWELANSAQESIDSDN